MDIKEAYLKVKALPNRNILDACFDLGDSWAFMFSISSSSDEFDPYDLSTYAFLDLGSEYDVVNKKNGRITQEAMNFTNSLMLKDKTEVDISQFSDLKRDNFMQRKRKK